MMNLSWGMIMKIDMFQNLEVVSEERRGKTGGLYKNLFPRVMPIKIYLIVITTLQNFVLMLLDIQGT